MSCYYLIGYYADPPGGTGLAGMLKGLSGDPWQGFRRIDVRSSRPGVRILARKGYWADDLGEPADAKDRGANAPPELRAVAGLLPRADLPLRAFATAFRGSAPGIHDVAIGVEVRFPESLQLPRTGDGLFVMDTTVDYRLVDAMDKWMPTLMQELYTTPAELIFGKATYQNFRRFRVRTDETIAIPKK
jgi:hypothetical protein